MNRHSLGKQKASSNIENNQSGWKGEPLVPAVPVTLVPARSVSQIDNFFQLRKQPVMIKVTDYLVNSKY